MLYIQVNNFYNIGDFCLTTVSCLRIQHSASNGFQTSDPLIISLKLYHWIPRTMAHLPFEDQKTLNRYFGKQWRPRWNAA